MSDEQFALSTSPAPSAPPPTEADYDAIFAAVMETVRGRWFLSEFGRRNRQADTKLVLAAIERLESTMRGDRESQSLERIRNDIREMAKAITLAKREIAAIGPEQEHSGRIGLATEELDSIVQTTQRATSDILAAAEQIQETAWTLREQGVDRAACDQIDHRSTDIYLSCSFQDLTGQRTRKVIQVLRYLEGRINAMVDVLGVDTSDAPSDEMPPEGHATHFATNLDQAEIDEVIPTTHAARMTDVEEDGGAHASHLIIDHAPDEVHVAEAAPTADIVPAASESTIATTDPISAPWIEPITDAAAITGYEPAIDAETPATQATPLSGGTAPGPELAFAEAPEPLTPDLPLTEHGEMASLSGEDAATTLRPIGEAESSGIEPLTDVVAELPATMTAEPDPVAAPAPWLAEVAVPALADEATAPAAAAEDETARLPGEVAERLDIAPAGASAARSDADSEQAELGIGPIGEAVPSGIEPATDVFAEPSPAMAAEPDPVAAPAPWLAEVAVPAVADEAAAPAAASDYETARLESEAAGCLDIAPQAEADADATPVHAEHSAVATDLSALPAIGRADEPPAPLMSDMDIVERSMPDHERSGMEAGPDAEPVSATAWQPPAGPAPNIVGNDSAAGDAALPSGREEQAETETWEPAIERAAASVRPVTPDTEALLANLLSIIRPITAPHDTAEAPPMPELAPSQAAADPEPDQEPDPVEEFAFGIASTPIEAATVAPAEIGVALPPMDAEYATPIDEAGVLASTRDVELGEPTEPAVAASIDQPIEQHFEITPIADASVAAIEHPDIVEPGILSSDFVIVPADEPVIESVCAEPVADRPPADMGILEFTPIPAAPPPNSDETADAGDASGVIDDFPLPEPAAAEAAAAPVPATLPEMDVIAADIAADAGDDVVLPGGELVASANPFAAAAIEDGGPIELVSFALARESAPHESLSPDMIRPAAESGTAVIATAHQPVQDADLAGAAEESRSTPLADIAVAPTATMMAAAPPPVAARAAKEAEPDSAAFGQTFPNDPLAPISWLSVEEKIALFS